MKTKVVDIPDRGGSAVLRKTMSSDYPILHNGSPRDVPGVGQRHFEDSL